MKEIKIGHYVRSKDGVIGKVIALAHTYIELDRKYYDTQYGFVRDITFDERITKHSPNIIDLIEENDYVNGYPVRKINGVLCNFDLNNMKWTPLKEIDVWRDIATHEQFNSIKYEVE